VRPSAPPAYEGLRSRCSTAELHRQGFTLYLDAQGGSRSSVLTIRISSQAVAVPAFGTPPLTVLGRSAENRLPHERADRTTAGLARRSLLLGWAAVGATSTGARPADRAAAPIGPAHGHASGCGPGAEAGSNPI